MKNTRVGIRAMRSILIGLEPNMKAQSVPLNYTCVSPYRLQRRGELSRIHTGDYYERIDFQDAI